MQKKQAPHLNNCEVRPSRQGNKLDVMLKNFTNISQSPSSIATPEIQKFYAPSTINLDQLATIQDFQCVTVNSVKIVNV